MSYFEDVLKWRRMMKLPVGDHVAKPSEFESPELELGVKLVREEFYEMMKGWADKDIKEVADGGADLIWVVCGLMVQMGVDMDKVWEGVRSANGAKAGGPRREDGKLLKPPGWKPPDTLADIRNGRQMKDIA